RNDHGMVLWPQTDIDGHCCGQQRMACPQQAEFRTLRAWSMHGSEPRGGALQLPAQAPLRDYKVNLSKQLQSLFHSHALPGQALGELPQDPAYLALFFRLDMEQFVVQLHHAIRLNVYRGTARRFPVHNTPQRLTKIGLQWDHEALIANRYHRILHDTAICSHEVAEDPMHAIAHTFETLADVL